MTVIRYAATSRKSGTSAGFSAVSSGLAVREQNADSGTESGRYSRLCRAARP